MTIPAALPRVSLIVLGAFSTLSALAGMALLTVGGGAGIPSSYLGPFDSFVIPGLILGIVVGGTQAWSTIALIRRSPLAPLASAIAGFGMQIWIAVEVAMVHDVVSLHIVYFVSGTLQLILVLVMLGVVPGLVRGVGAAPRS
jgi:hypothetical protein